MMKKIEMKIIIEVSDNWIDDGFGSSNIGLERTVKNLLDENILTYAYEREKKFTVKVTKNNTQKGRDGR